MAVTAADKAEIMPLVETVLGWDLKSSVLPDAGVSLGLIAQFTAYGRILADDLRTLCRSIPADSDAGRSAHATLGEAARRLPLPLPSTTPRAAAHRAQNIARLIQALTRAADGCADVWTRPSSIREGDGPPARTSVGVRARRP